MRKGSVPDWVRYQISHFLNSIKKVIWTHCETFILHFLFLSFSLSFYSLSFSLDTKLYRLDRAIAIDATSYFLWCKKGIAHKKLYSSSEAQDFLFRGILEGDRVLSSFYKDESSWRKQREAFYGFGRHEEAVSWFENRYWYRFFSLLFKEIKSRGAFRSFVTKEIPGNGNGWIIQLRMIQKAKWGKESMWYRNRDTLHEISFGSFHWQHQPQKYKLDASTFTLRF